MTTKQPITHNYMDKNEFHKNLILNDKINNDDEFNKKCSAMIDSINELDHFDINMFFIALKSFDTIDNNNFNDLFKLYEISKNKKISAQKKEGFANFLELLNNFNNYTKNQEILKNIITNFNDFIHQIIDYITKGYIYMLDSYNENIFVKTRLPIIRLIKYCLQNNLFSTYFKLAQKIEPCIINIFFETYKTEIIDIINKNKNNPNVLYIVTNLDENNINEIFKINLLPLLENATNYLILNLIRNDVPKKYIINDFFINGFKKCEFTKQIDILEYLEDFEYPQEFINNLHHKLNKESKCPISVENTIEISKSKFDKICHIIEHSSYFIKNNIQNSELWKLIIAISNNEPINQVQISNLYEKLVHLYSLCYNHATTSITNNIYPLNTLQEKITYLENTKFNIFAICCDTTNCHTPEDLLKNQNFAWGNILTENNFSHPYDEGHLFGFYTNITPSSIVHIFPAEPVLPNLSCKYKKDITWYKPILLDIDDLNYTTLNNDTFSSVFIRTKTQDNQIIIPNCIICLDEVDKDSLNLAQKFNQKILVLKKNSKTIENNERVSYHGTGETEQ